MRGSVVAGMALMLVVAGCGSVGQSRLNPLNWFGRSEATQAVAATPADPRILVADVTLLVIEPNPGGAIVRATGLPPSQGWWDARLERDPAASSESEVVFRFVVQPPPEPRPASTQQSREVTVARYLTNHQLEDVRRITVTGAGNARTVARR